MTAAISSINAAATLVASALGTTIVSLSHTTKVTQKGVYRITGTVVMGAGPAAGDASNAQIVVGSTTAVVPTTAVAGSAASVTVYATLDGSTDVLLQVGPVGASTVPYSGSLVAEYGGPAGGLFTGR